MTLGWLAFYLIDGALLILIVWNMRNRARDQRRIKRRLL